MTILDRFRSSKRQGRSRRKYPITKRGTWTLIILIVIFAGIDVTLVFLNIHETQEGVFWGVLGIQCAVVVGVLLFLMQMKSDRRISKIIEKQNTRYIQAKSYLSNEIIDKLREFRQTYVDLLPVVQDFESGKDIRDYLNRLQTLVLMSQK